MNAPVRIPESQWDYPVAVSGWGHEEHMAMARVIASGQFTCGAEVEALEDEFRTAHNMRHAIAVNSGSSANLISVAALRGRLSATPVAAVPALAWATTFAPLIQHGFDLRVCDCDETWNVSSFPISDLWIACPILGNPAYLAQTAIMANGFHVPLIVDNCESIGAYDERGTLCGTQGILNTFSFYFSHQMSAIEGGMILTNDDHLARACRQLRNHGWHRSHETFENEYRFESFGYNVRPIELHAAIAREQLKKHPARARARKANFAYFSASVGDLPIKLPEIKGNPSFFGIHFTVESRDKRAELAAALRARRIDCRPPVAGSFRKQPYGKRWADQQTPNADRIHERGMMLGNPPFDAAEMIDRAVSVMREVL